ncbi:MAG: tetratricopeptide repeat protein [Pseudomonadota bacterium]
MTEQSVETSPELVAFGKRVRKERKRRQWTQESLAETALSNRDRKGYISEIERGKRPDITGETIRKIASALDIAIEEADGAIIVPSTDGETDRTPLEIRLDSLGEDAKRAADNTEGLQETLRAIQAQLAATTQYADRDKKDLLSDLQVLAQAIMERDVPVSQLSGILPEMLKKLADLRSERGNWAGMSNEEPEIAPLLQQADDALAAGPGFSLETAEKALEAADRRYGEIIDAREEQAKSGKINRAKIIGKRAEMAALKFAYLEAADLYQEQAKLQKQAFGRDSEEYAFSLNEAAVNFNDAGLHRKAEPLFRKGLDICQRVLGEDHPDTATSYNNVAGCLNAQGHHSDAEPLFRKGLDIRQQVLGEDHPDTAQSYNNVAGCLDEQGRHSNAEPLYRKGLDIRQRVLGEDHPNTATSYNNVASCLDDQGLHSDAEPLYRKGLDIRQRVLGEDHPNTATSYNNVASCLDDQGLHSDAEPLYRKSLEICQRVLGEEHPDTANSYNNVASNLARQGLWGEALPLFEKAYEIISKILGDAHPNAQTLLYNLNDTRAKLGLPPHTPT